MQLIATTPSLFALALLSFLAPPVLSQGHVVMTSPELKPLPDAHEVLQVELSNVNMALLADGTIVTSPFGFGTGNPVNNAPTTGGFTDLS